MGLDFNRTNSAPQASGRSNARQGDDRPSATRWLNIGVPIERTVTDAAGVTSTVEDFVSLPIGVALDTMQPNELKGSNDDYLKRMVAGNDMLEQLKQFAATLQPGETRVLNLSVQLRAVNGPVAAPAADTNNAYSVKLQFEA